jgi:disulfide oxidoreductase YuzD
MDRPVPVRIFGVPTACETGVTDAWREVADWAGERLTARFGQQVTVEYYDLFSPELHRFPEVLDRVKKGDGAVPLVFVGNELLSAGGKVSVPAIRHRLEALGLGLREAKPEDHILTFL